MSNSINYKIQKYSYKLQNATNSKEKALYQSKLNSYKNQLKGGKSMRGGELEKSLIDELTDMFNTTLGLDDKLKQSQETLDKLGKEFDAIMEKLRAQCCKGDKDCTPEVKAAIDSAIKEKSEDFKKFVQTLATQTGDQVKEKVKNYADTESEDFKKLVKKLSTPCPPSEKKEEEAAPEAPGEPGEQVAEKKHAPVKPAPGLMKSVSGPETAGLTEEAAEAKKQQEEARKQLETAKGGGAKHGVRRLKY